MMDHQAGKQNFMLAWDLLPPFEKLHKSHETVSEMWFTARSIIAQWRRLGHSETLVRSADNRYEDHLIC